MTKRGRPYRSQPETSEATKHQRVEFDEAVDDVIPIALAHKLRDRLRIEQAGTSAAMEDVDKRKPRGKKTDYLYCRQNPTEFISVIQSLTPRQKEAVNELGFGAVLNFNIKEVPGYLAYRVLKSFNLARCEIQLSGGERLTLDEEDVHLTLGFPRGTTQIARKEEYQTNFQFNDQVAARCNKNRYKLNAADVANLIKEETDGGPDFKRLFMFLLENALIETPSDGHCKPKILHFIDDVDEIRNMNWCGYVLSVLEVTYPGWDRAEGVYFTGPIHFILCAYVDRVVHIRRRVVRAWPTIKGWTAEALKQREEVEINEFGSGRLEGRIDKEQYLIDDERRRVESVNREGAGVPSMNRAKRIRDGFIASSVLMGQAISRWVDDFKQIPVELLDDGCIRLGSQIGKKLLGMEDENTTADEDIVSTLTQAKEDEEEYSPEWIAEMEKMMQAYDNKKTITRGFDRPSFVLDGFECPDPFATQETQRAQGNGRGEDNTTVEETSLDTLGDVHQGYKHKSVGGSGAAAGQTAGGEATLAETGEIRGNNEDGRGNEGKDKAEKAGGKGKRAPVTKKNAEATSKGIEIGVAKTPLVSGVDAAKGDAGKGVALSGLDIPEGDFEGDGRFKQMYAKGRGKKPEGVDIASETSMKAVKEVAPQKGKGKMVAVT